MVARPAASTFLSQSTPSPKGSDMRNPSGVGTAHTGVAYSRPEWRPVLDGACEEVAAPGQLHHDRVAEALVDGARRIGDLLYSLQAEER